MRDNLWPDDRRADFGRVFDEVLIARRYPRHLVLRLPAHVSFLGGAAFRDWLTHHRPPAPWAGSVTTIATADRECSPSCAACATWDTQHGAAADQALAAFEASARSDPVRAAIKPPATLEEAPQPVTPPASREPRRGPEGAFGPLIGP